MVSSTGTGVLAAERLPYPLISPFKGKGEITIVLANLLTEHSRLMRSARILVQDFEGMPDATSSTKLPLRLELSSNELIWRTEHSLDRNRPFALFSLPGESIRSQLDSQALEWLLYVEHRRILHRTKLISVTRSIESLQSGLSNIRSLEQRLCELGGNTAPTNEAGDTTAILAHSAGQADVPTLSGCARRRRRARRPSSIYVGRSSALRNLDDLSREHDRIASAFEELREDWRPRITASGIGLFPGEGALPAMRWRVTNATQHGKRRRIDLTDPECAGILRKLDHRVALRAIATETIRIDWSTRAAAVHGSRLAYIEYREALRELQAQAVHH